MTRRPTDRRRRPVADLRRDDDLRAIQEFTSLVVASARSTVQRDRLRRAVGAPITGASMTALQTIERLGPIAMSKLAERLELDQSTLSRQVRPLEEEGLVTRTADANDRRVARLASTAKGSTLLHRMRDVSLNDYDVALRDWPATDRAQLAALLDRFRRALLDVRVDRWGWSVDVAGE